MATHVGEIIFCILAVITMLLHFIRSLKYLNNICVMSIMCVCLKCHNSQIEFVCTLPPKKNAKKGVFVLKSGLVFKKATIVYAIVAFSC